LEHGWKLDPSGGVGKDCQVSGYWVGLGRKG